MIRWLHFTIAVLGLAAIVSCGKRETAAPYDNTAERLEFHKRYNAKVLTEARELQAKLRTELVGELTPEERTEKQRDLDSVTHRLERPDFFEILTEADLPKDLEWVDGQEEPEIGSPEATKGGTFHSYFLGNAYPSTIRSIGEEANNSFRSNHWDDIELSLATLHPDTGNIIPGLADRWAVAPDGQTVYFHIDKDARWSDGKKVKSADWLMAFYIYLSPYTKVSFYPTYYGEQYWGVATYGDDYVCIRLSTPKPLAAVFAGLSPFQEEFYREFGPDFCERYNWRPRPTTGAYQILKEDIQKGRSIALTRVKDWWAKDRKFYRHRFNADRLEYLLVRDEEKVFQMFLRGDIDTYLLGDARKWYEKTEVPAVHNGYIEKATFYNQYPAVSRGLYFNLSRPLLSNLDVRIGLQHASNWEKVIEVDMRGDAQRLNLASEGYGEFSNPNIRTRPYSIPLAREAFARAGFTRTGADGILENDQGSRLSFTITYSRNPQLEPFMLRLKEEARKAGVEFKLEALDHTASFQKVQARKEHEIAFMGWQSPPPFPDYYQSFHSKDAYEPGTKKPRPLTNNISIFADPEVDRLSEAVRNARTTEEIRTASWRIEEILHEQAVFVPAFYRPFYRTGSWRWIRWPDNFNVRLGNEPEMNYVYWIDQKRKEETLEARNSGKTFPEKNLIFDQYRTKQADK